MSNALSSSTFELILGVRFLDAPAEVAVQLLDEGGLMVVPSAPGLASLPHDEAYRHALLGCDFAIIDSAYLALTWLAIKRKAVTRVSGLKFLRAFLESGRGRGQGELFLVNPSQEDTELNIEWLRAAGFSVGLDDCYTAPRYDPASITDPALCALLEARRPKYVMLNIGGGVQEPLGFYLRRSLGYKPAIICTGAAIAFLTGRQANIPGWVDALGLGWLARVFDDPRRFVPRYLRAAGLAKLVLQHKGRMPPLVKASPRQQS
jgi:N-acetylglucosaminyldiphosphoundecaprenol N-acetyl-beta-D-mannosaminyltransferase